VARSDPTRPKEWAVVGALGLRSDPTRSSFARTEGTLVTVARSDATRPKEWAAGGSDQSSESEGAGTL
jgi:hypothetical protein